MVKELENHEVRVFSRLFGHLSTFNFDINKVLGLFDNATDAESMAGRVSEICRRDGLTLVRELYEKGFLVDDDKTYDDMLSEYIDTVRRKSRVPKVSKVTFLVSSSCNLACKGCYHGFYDFKSEEMTPDFADRVLDGLFPYLKKRGVPALLISFLGYEPLTNFPVLRRICEKAARAGDEHGIKTSFKIYTNAFAVSDEIYEWIEAYKSRLSFAVSLDGIKEDNDRRRVDLTGGGIHDRVMEHLKRIVATGVECSVLTVLSTLNFDNLEKFVDEIAAVGVKTITANIFCGQSEEERQMELAIDDKVEAVKRMDLATEKYGIEFNGEWKFPVVQMITGAQLFCPAGTRQFVFCADGAVIPCQRFAGTEVTLGTYKEGFWEGLLEGQCEGYNRWTHDLYNGVAERAHEDKTAFAGCVCPFLPFIRGESISKNLESEFDARLVDYYLTRPVERILSATPLDCSH